MNAYLVRVFLCVCAATIAALIVAIFPAQAQILRKDGLLPVLLQQLEPFGRWSGVAPAGPMWERWREFENGVAQSAAALARCRAEPVSCSDAETRLVAVIDNVRALQGRAKLGILNREINLSIAYVSDRLQHAQADVWSDAITTFKTGRGDCEDFATAKYLALREAGISPEDLRLVIARVNVLGQAHAVVAARLDGHWLILDNRHMAMLDDVNARELEPLFAFGDDGVHQFGAPVEIDNVAAGGNALPVLM